MLAADAELEVCPRRAPTIDTHLHQGADTVPINRNKRVGRIDLGIGIGMHEGARIITADAKRCLRQVVRTK